MNKAVLALLSTLFLSTTAVATPILQGTTSAAEGVNGLSIGGATYDVSFSNSSSYDTAFGSTIPAFLNNQATAELARDALSSFLTSSAITNIANVPSGPSYVFIPYELTTNNVLFALTGQLASGGTNWTDNSTGTLAKATGFPNISWASFTAVSSNNPIPEPATVLLFALGLAGIGASGYARSKAA